MDAHDAFDSAVRTLLLEEEVTPADLIERLKEVSLSAPRKSQPLPPVPAEVSPPSAILHLGFLRERYGETSPQAEAGIFRSVNDDRIITIYPLSRHSSAELATFFFESTGIHPLSHALLLGFAAALIAEDQEWKRRQPLVTSLYPGFLKSYCGEIMVDAGKSFFGTLVNLTFVRIYCDLPTDQTEDQLVECRITYTSPLSYKSRQSDELPQFVETLKTKNRRWKDSVTPAKIKVDARVVFRPEFLMSIFGAGNDVDKKQHCWEATSAPGLSLKITCPTIALERPQKLVTTFWELSSSKDTSKEQAYPHLRKLITDCRKQERQWLFEHHPEEFEEYTLQEYFEPLLILKEYGNPQETINDNFIWRIEGCGEEIVIKGSTDNSNPRFQFTLRTILPDGRDRLKTFLAQLRRKAFEARLLPVPEIGVCGHYPPKCIEDTFGSGVADGNEHVWQYESDDGDLFWIRIRSQFFDAIKDYDQKLDFWIALETKTCAGICEAQAKLKGMIADLEISHRQWLLKERQGRFETLKVVSKKKVRFGARFISDSMGEPLKKRGLTVWEDQNKAGDTIFIVSSSSFEAFTKALEEEGDLVPEFEIRLVSAADYDKEGAEEALDKYLRSLREDEKIWSLNHPKTLVPEEISVSALDASGEGVKTKSYSVTSQVTLSQSFLWDKYGSGFTDDHGGTWKNFTGTLKNITLKSPDNLRCPYRGYEYPRKYEISCSSGDSLELQRAIDFFTDKYQEYQERKLKKAP